MTISNAPDAPFAEPWQAQAFALTVELHRQGAFTWSEWSAALGARLAAGGGGEYYEHWLAALEALLAAKGLVDPPALAARKADWERAYRDTPHGKPVELRPPDPSNECSERRAWRQSAVPRCVADCLQSRDSF